MEKKINSNRVIAAIIDQIFVSLISSAVGFAFGISIMEPTSDILYNYGLFIGDWQFNLIIVFLGIVELLIYFIWFTAIPMLNKNRATVGKLLMKIKVIREDDQIPTFKNMLIRNIRVFLYIPVFISQLLQMIDAVAEVFITINAVLDFVVFVVYMVIVRQINKGNRTFHDKYARTIVVDSLYDPNLKNYETIEEIKEWADVEGFEVKKEKEEVIDPTDQDYWK